jgi:hypothetical protein
VRIKLQPDKKGKSVFLKIRPYLISSENNTMQLNKTIQNCFVKVFTFESQKNANNDKYLNWKIYKLKNKN